MACPVGGLMQQGRVVAVGSVEGRRVRQLNVVKFGVVERTSAAIAHVQPLYGFKKGIGHGDAVDIFPGPLGGLMALHLVGVEDDAGTQNEPPIGAVLVLFVFLFGGLLEDHQAASFTLFHFRTGSLPLLERAPLAAVEAAIGRFDP